MILPFIEQAFSSIYIILEGKLEHSRLMIRPPRLPYAVGTSMEDTECGENSEFVLKGNHQYSLPTFFPTI